MAKKVVASLQTKKAKDWVKIVRPEKNPKTGAYSWKEYILPTSIAKDVASGKVKI